MIVYYFRQILIALDELQRKGLAHRDIKPDNICLSQDLSHVKLIDFGHTLEDKPVSDSAGTVEYMSP